MRRIKLLQQIKLKGYSVSESKRGESNKRAGADCLTSGSIIKGGAIELKVVEGKYLFDW